MNSRNRRLDFKTILQAFTVVISVGTIVMAAGEFKAYAEQKIDSLQLQIDTTNGQVKQNNDATTILFERIERRLIRIEGKLDHQD